DDLMKMAADSAINSGTVTTFKGIRIMNGHSVETVGKNNLDFLISHRFGEINQGIKEFFGLDAGTIRLGLEYGLTDRFMVGIGRSSFQKSVDIFAKYRVFRQTAGNTEMPLSLTAFGSYAVRTQQPFGMSLSGADRSSYTGQLLIARKFSERFSLQLSPSFIYRKLTDEVGDKQLVVATGVGGRLKLTKRTSLNGEWFYVLPNQISTLYTNNLSFGFDIETGGHVFQLLFTNSYGMAERQFITETNGAWNKGDVHFGFNISRTFSFNKKARYHEKY
ncbi:MAG: DUF5777 family beta-barrel protein, partial [Sphingobacteriaceae bacterium]